jgi:hypothetical protein
MLCSESIQPDGIRNAADRLGFYIRTIHVDEAGESNERGRNATEPIPTSSIVPRRDFASRSFRKPEVLALIHMRCNTTASLRASATFATLAGSPIERLSERFASVTVARLHPRRQKYRG